MRYLIRLVTRRGGLVLDPYAGSGTTGLACVEECMRAVLIEREPSYCEIIRQRIRPPVPSSPGLFDHVSV